jgi:hypothetical protein
MTKNNKKIVLSVIVLFIIMIVPMLASAQSIDPEPLDPEGAVPLDGGLSLLVAAGVGYGAKKLKAKRALASSNKN